MARRLKLRKYNVVNVNYQYLGAFRLRVVAEALPGEDTDPNVFVFKREPPDPYTGVDVDTFCAICSPVDLADFPALEPDVNRNYPFFRRAEIELDFRATSQAEEIWLTIIREVGTLMQAMDRLEQLVLTEEVVVGNAPDSGPSLSASTSDSISH